MEHLRKSGTWPKHAPESGHGVARAKVLQLPVSTRAVLANALNEELHAHNMFGMKDDELGELWAWDRERVRDARNGSVRLTPRALADMGEIGEAVLARVSGRRAA